MFFFNVTVNPGCWKLICNSPAISMAVIETDPRIPCLKAVHGVPELADLASFLPACGCL